MELWHNCRFWGASSARSGDAQCGRRFFTAWLSSTAVFDLPIGTDCGFVGESLGRHQLRFLALISGGGRSALSIFPSAWGWPCTALVDCAMADDLSVGTGIGEFASNCHALVTAGQFGIGSAGRGVIGAAAVCWSAVEWHLANRWSGGFTGWWEGAGTLGSHSELVGRRFVRESIVRTTCHWLSSTGIGSIGHGRIISTESFSLALVSHCLTHAVVMASQPSSCLWHC